MMGYESFIEPRLRPLAEYRDQFPVTENLVYLNHAAVAPLCRPAADAMKHLAEDALTIRLVSLRQWLDAYEGVTGRSRAADWLQPVGDCDCKEYVRGHRDGGAGNQWKPGDKIVAFEERVPANYFPWKRLEAKGVKIEWLRFSDPLDRIDEAARGARLLTISFVQYSGGYRADLEAIGEICHRRGTLFFVDAIQGLGALPLDVRKCRIHGLAADGHKWLLGPEGCGILYIQQDIQDQIDPVEFGWTNIAGFNDYSCRDMTLRPTPAGMSVER